MEGAWLVGTQRSSIRSRLARLRWRRRGAWLWPTFVVMTAADAVIGHELPPVGASQQIFAAALLGGIFNLLGVIVLSWPLSLALRRKRPDLPVFVARDYGGTFVVVAITAALLGTGIAHRSTILQRSTDARDAAVRA